MVIRVVPLEPTEPACPTITSPANGVAANGSSSAPIQTQSSSNASPVTPKAADPTEDFLTKKRHAGRPLKGREHHTLENAAPWEKANLSRSTWFRRRKDGTL